MRDMAAHLHARPDLLERTGRGDIHSKSTPAQARRRLATRYRACPSPSWPRAHPARPARAAAACAACCAGPQKPAARLFCNHAQPSIPDGKSSMLTASGRSCGARGWPGGSRRAADSTGTAIAFLSGPSCRRVRRPHGRRGKGEGGRGDKASKRSLRRRAGDAHLTGHRRGSTDDPAVSRPCFGRTGLRGGERWGGPVPGKKQRGREPCRARKTEFGATTRAGRRCTRSASAGRRHEHEPTGARQRRAGGHCRAAQGTGGRHPRASARARTFYRHRIAHGIGPALHGCGGGGGGQGRAL